MMSLVISGHIAATWYMVGLIWFVQLVHYPMMDRAADFIEYERVHCQKTTWAVGPAMLIEIATLVVWGIFQPELLVDPLYIGLASLLGIIWVSTACLQVPAHHRLSQGYNAATHRWLVNSNWIRTFAWSLRGVGVLFLTPSS